MWIYDYAYIFMVKWGLKHHDYDLCLISRIGVSRFSASVKLASK